MTTVRENVSKQRAEEIPERNQERVESTTKCVNEESDFFPPMIKLKDLVKNMDAFHFSNHHEIKQCTVRLEAWPVKLHSYTQSTSA